MQIHSSSGIWQGSVPAARNYQLSPVTETVKRPVAKVYTLENKSSGSFSTQPENRAMPLAPIKNRRAIAAYLEINQTSSGNATELLSRIDEYI